MKPPKIKEERMSAKTRKKEVDALWGLIWQTPEHLRELLSRLEFAGVRPPVVLNSKEREYIRYKTMLEIFEPLKEMLSHISAGMTPEYMEVEELERIVRGVSNRLDRTVHWTPAGARRLKR
jgi:hypothetical protein